MDVSTLPDDVREKLAELELELSEGEFFALLFWLKLTFDEVMLEIKLMINIC